MGRSESVYGPAERAWPRPLRPAPAVPQWLTCFVRPGAPLYGASKPNGA
jgi:hypothetical protein